MKVQIHYFEHYVKEGKLNHDLAATHIKNIEIEKFNPDEILRKLNIYGHGICLTNTETQEKWLTKSFGWLVGDSMTIFDYVVKNRHNLIWE